MALAFVTLAMCRIAGFREAKVSDAIEQKKLMTAVD